MSRPRDLFKTILTNEFNIGSFTTFTKEFFNDLEVVRPDKFMDDGWNWSEFNFYIKGYYHIGNFIGDDKAKVAVFAVELKDYKNIDRARSMQRNFVKKLMNAGNADGAIVAFYAEDEAKWRLSFVRMDYEFAKGKVTEKLTPAKRYSYLVGKGEPCHTAQERLLPIFENVAANPTLDTIEEAFSVEKVTKEFFDRYSDKYYQLKEELEKNKDFLGEAKRHNFTPEQFAKKLMGQIAFLYFVQKKGWLGVNAIPRILTGKEYKNAFYSQGKVSQVVIAKVYKKISEDEYKLIGINNLSEDEELVLSRSVKGMPWGTGPKDFMRKLFETCKDKGGNFFDDYLEPLFYEALNENRGEAGYFTKLHCRIPFLNGGLFEPLENYDWNHNDFHLDNSIFSNRDEKGERDADGILDIFDRYNFTMNEDEPLEREVAIDPEMLGKIFENLLDGSERKSKGAFYTPREIVHYMCQESLANYLVNETGIAYEDIKDFIIYGEFMKDEDTSYGSKISGEMYIPESIFSRKKGINRLDEIDKALANVKVADPSVGSGAFPLGMVSEIVKLRKTITAYLALNMNEYQIKMMHEIDRHPYKLKLETIKNSIFAVDIDASAIDITKLRLWLSLVVEQQTNERVENELFIEGRNPRPLPNLDCNIRCGNSLIDEFKGIKLVNESTLFGDNMVQMIIGQNPYEGLLNQLFEAQDKLFYENNHQTKEETKKKIRNIIDTIIMFNMSKAAPEVIKDYNEFKKIPSPPWFVWQLEFAKVFKDKKGFDIVIGNPPYVGESGHKDIFRPIADTEFGERFYIGKMDLFYFFFHKGLDILHDRGELSLITTNYYPTAMGAKKLRNDLKERSQIRELINFNEVRVFESALGQHNMITTVTKNKSKKVLCNSIVCTESVIANANKIKDILYGIEKNIIKSAVEQDNLYDGKDSYIRQMGVRATEDNSIESILDKMVLAKSRLGELCEINQGVVTGCDTVSAKNLTKLSSQNNKIKNDGIYVLDLKNSRDREVFETLKDEEEIFRDFYKNSDITRYWCSEIPSKKLIYFMDRIDKEKYPKTYEHLSKFKEILEARLKTYNEKYHWTALHRPRRESVFEAIPKIVAPYRAKYNTFAYNECEWFCRSDVYVITAKSDDINLKYLLGLLNSKLYFLWLYYRGKRKGEVLELFQIPLSEIPIIIANEEKYRELVELVELIIRGKKENVNNQNTEVEDRINTIVYEIFNLTSEEIKIVEDEAKTYSRE